MHGTGDQLIAAYLTLREDFASTEQKFDDPGGLNHAGVKEFAVWTRNVNKSAKQVFLTLRGLEYTSYTN